MFMPSLLTNDFMDDFFGFYPAKKGTSKIYKMTSDEVMKTDIKETDGGYELEIDLPGYKKEDVKAELKDGYMTISAEKKTETDEKAEDGKYIHRERYFGSCSRSFYVGEQISEDDVKAKFEDGILKMFVPKKDAKPAVEEKKYISIAG